MRGYHFSENEEVAHVDCLDVKMRVIKICWRYTNRSTGVSEANPKQGFKKERIKFLEGIECQWWEGRSLKTKRFHSQMLVPWIIAERGQQEVTEWIEQIQ